ncbi:hypothetical protein [Spirosoma flavum]|uniref:Uncharacterized protein n=1 Tax=Spirosoma flavum TaxID=2048557 RepID=A0ABW6AL53_9BACT
MILSLTTITSEAEYRNFSCQFSDLETAFDLLNAIVSEGDQLIEAELLDRDERTLLPIEAFDGESCIMPIKQLEKQWEQILSKPVTSR